MGSAVRLFVSEYLTSGLVSGVANDSSLLREGGAMLSSFLQDCDRLPDVQCVTTLSSGCSFRLPDAVEVIRVADHEHAQNQFKSLTAEADKTLVIAPESDGILADLQQQVRQNQGNWIGCDREAILLTTDKYRFYQHLKECRLPIIKTELWDGEFKYFPAVIKPRDGAGGESTWLLQNKENAEQFLTLQPNSESGNLVIQPYQSGQACSVAVLSHEAGHDIFPAGKQIVRWNEGFSYHGGELSLPLNEHERSSLQELISKLQTAIPGLVGYWGMDFIYEPTQEIPFQIVEVNPRLTTSYVGYQQITTDNLAGRWLFPQKQTTPLVWTQTSCRFGKDF